MKTFDTLYNYDSNKRLRIWRGEVDGDKYRFHSGLDDGKKVTSEWKIAFPKNTGKKNATTAEEQAVAEVEALYKKKKKRGYSTDPENISEPYIKPMLARAKYDLNKLDFVNDKVWVQPKLDGFRCVITRDGMFSRSGEKILNCDHIFEKMEEAFDLNPNIKAFDGELYNHDYCDDFNTLSSLIRKEKISEEKAQLAREKLQFHCYDIIFHNATVLFSTRLDVLYGFGNTDCFKVVETIRVNTIDRIVNLRHNYIDHGYEGTIIRTEDVYHENKRPKSVIKFKRLEDDEFVIKSVNEGQGNWAGYAKSLTVVLHDGQECNCGIKGNQEFTKKLLENADYWVDKKATLEYDGYTPDKRLRFPVAVKFHDSGLEDR